MIGTVATRFNLLRSYHHFLRSSLSFLSLSSFEIWEQDRDCSLVIEVIAEKQVKLLLRLIMGISKAVGVVGLVFFFAAVYLKDLSMKLIPLSLLYDSFIASLVSVASHPVINFPLIFGKGSNGKFPLWSKILFFPFLFLVRVYAFFKRLKSREPIYNEISEGLYVGGWPSSKKHLPPGDPAVIDCTCELPRSSVVSEDAYLCLPTWDTRAPQPSQIETAVRWASKMWAQKKPIYVHCAFGGQTLQHAFLPCSPNILCFVFF